MKKNIIILFFAAIFCVTLNSCYKDTSKSATMDILKMTIIEPDDAPDYITTYFGTDFELTPEIGRLVGRDTIKIEGDLIDDYTYSWKINLAPNDTLSNILSSDFVLKTVIPGFPNSQNYDLELTITEKETGMRTVLIYDVRVLNDLGAGILIAETVANSHDLALISSRDVNINYDKDAAEPYSVKRNLYATANDGAKYPEKIDQLNYHMYTWRKEESGTRVLSKNSRIALLDADTFREKLSNDGMFFFAPYNNNFEHLFTDYSVNVYLIRNGIIHDNRLDSGNRYSYESESVLENQIFAPFSAGTFIYDTKNDGFIRMSYDNQNVPNDDTGAFNPANLEKDLSPIFADSGSDYSYPWLMKDSEGKLLCYVIAQTLVNGSYVYAGKNITDFSGLIDINNATSYSFSGSHNMMYYSVDNKLYTAVYDGSTISRNEVVYTLPSDETISFIKIHKRGDGETTFSEDVNGDPIWEGSLNKVIYIISQKGDEGIVRIIPIEYPASGTVAADKYIKTIGGFGTITAIDTKY